MRVRLHAGLRSYLPADATDNFVEIEVPAGATAATVARALGIPDGFAGVAFARGEKCDMRAPLRPDDELDLFPPLAGG